MVDEVCSRSQSDAFVTLAVVRWGTQEESSPAFMSLVLMLMMIRESDCILITQASRTASDSHISLQRLFTANDRQVLSMRDTTLYDVQDEEMRTAVISFIRMMITFNKAIYVISHSKFIYLFRIITAAL